MPKRNFENLAHLLLGIAAISTAVAVERAVEKDWPEALTFVAGAVGFGLTGWYGQRK